MTLTDRERERLADVVRLQPTSNGELGERWGMESGSEVHAYLEAHLADYYYRDDDSYVRATPEAATLVDAEPGVEGDEGEAPTVVRVPPLEARVAAVVPGPEERSASVVRVLHAVRETGFAPEPDVDAVRAALRALRRKGVVEVEYRTVPTFRRAADAADATVELIDDPDRSAAAGDGDGDGDGDESDRPEPLGTVGGDEPPVGPNA
jgi:hypothetical protein